MSEEYIQVLTTTENREEADRIAKSLVERRLAGCAQVIGPIVSTYWWKGNIETGEEWLCFIKSKRDLYGELESAIKEMHPAETPEIIALPIVAGSRGYLGWLGEEIRKS